MSDIKEARRLVERYDLAFKNGRQKLFEEKDIHIGVLQVVIATLELKINDLSFSPSGKAILTEIAPEEIKNRLG